MLTKETCLHCGLPLGWNEYDKHWTHQDIWNNCKNPEPKNKNAIPIRVNE